MEKEELKAKWEALSLEEKERVLAAFKSLDSKPVDANMQAPIKQGVATLTYKQIAKNFPNYTERQVRQTIRRMNKKKRQVQVVNGPGSVLSDDKGSYIITKKGKSMRI